MRRTEVGNKVSDACSHERQSTAIRRLTGLGHVGDSTSKGLDSVLAAHLGGRQSPGLEPVNASTMSPASGGEGESRIPEPPVLPGRIHQVYRRNHSRGAIRNAIPCVCREPSKKNLGWEAQYIYEVDARGLSDAEKQMLYIHMYAVKDNKKYERETPIHGRVIDEELWQVFPSGFSNTDPHAWNVPYPKYWKLETDLTITITAAFVKDGYEPHYDIKKLRQEPSAKWKQEHGKDRPNTEEGWVTTNPGGQPTSIPEHRKAVGSSATRVFKFNPLHPWFLGPNGIVILSPQDIEDGNIGEAIDPADDPIWAVMNQWKPAGGTYRGPGVSAPDPRDPVDPPGPEGGENDTGVPEPSHPR